MFGTKAVVDELKRIRWAIEALDRKIDALQGEIKGMKEHGNIISLPDTKDPDTEAVNAIYKTKAGLFSFKKAKRAMRED